MADKILRGRATLYPFAAISKPNSIFPNTTNGLFSTHTSSPNQSHYRRQIALGSLLQRYGFSPSQLQDFLGNNRFLLNSSLQDIEKSLGILSSFKIPQKAVVSLVTSCPGVLEIEFLKQWKVGFAKSGNLGASPMVIKSVLEHSRRIRTLPDGFIKSLKVLEGLGFSEYTMRRVLEGFPWVVTMKESEINRKIQFFMEMGFCRDEVDWVLGSSPEALGFSVENRLILLLGEFEDLGFSKELVRKEIVKDPRVLGMEVGELSRCLDLLRTLKCREPIKMKIFDDGPFRAGFEVKLRVDCLCKHGLIRREALKVLWKEPRVILYGIDEIEKKIEFLVKTMGFNTGCLVDVPEYLGVSFEKQIVPRYNVIEYLRGKGALGDEVGLKDMIKLSRFRFYNLYVKPYPECEKFFSRFCGDVQVKIRHPPGLWKLFKPHRPPESEEDVNNIKSFLENLA